MAVVKIHQIRSTLSAGIEYIVNLEKTQSGALVTTYGCAPTPGAPNLIANDFLLLQEEADRLRTTGARPTVLGLHVIQSFKPGEVSAEKAHEIGIEFANKITGGEHQYVLATHLDRGHIHNHLIFNPVNEVTLKRYRTPKNQVFKLRDISDELCREHGLNIIESPKREDQPPSLGERHARVRGASTKDTLRASIDQAVAKTTDLTELVGALHQNGIEVTFRGRDMLVRDTTTMTRPIRAWRLGPAYSESNLAARLGRNPVTTFTAAAQMVTELDIHTYKVKIPRLTGYYLAVPKGQILDHGKTWHIHLPEASTTPVVNRSGGYEVAFTPQELATWFTPHEDHRISLQAREQGSMRPRGRTDKQRRYFASVDRRAALLAESFEKANFAAEVARMTLPEREELLDATQTRLTLAREALRHLVIKRDDVQDEERTAVETAIHETTEAIRADETAQELLQPEPPQQHHELKGQRR